MSNRNSRFGSIGVQDYGHFLNFGGVQLFLKIWWNTVIFQILVEHNHFSNFGGTWSFLKFWWNRVIFIFPPN